MRAAYLILAFFFLLGMEANAQVPMPPKPGTTSNNSSKVSNNATIKAQLRTINDAFETYNSYKTKFRVEGSRLIWKNDYSEISGNLRDLIFYASYEDKWLAIKCRDGNCMDGTSFPEEYSMSLRTKSGEIAPVIEEVVNAFNLIREQVLRN